MNSVKELADNVIQKLQEHQADHLFTVAISGIDASGKGFISKQLEEELKNRGIAAANINIDPWQEPIPVRLKKENAAENIYENIFRWNEFFEQLIFPLQEKKSIYLETQVIRTDADIYYPLTYDYRNPDIILVEGILLFKRKYLSWYDLKIWVDCSFETGLQRAIMRNVENLDTEKLIEDYKTYYYPAQKIHITRDNPLAAADIIFENNNRENET
jgi:uridine kinase